MKKLVLILIFAALLTAGCASRPEASSSSAPSSSGTSAVSSAASESSSASSADSGSGSASVPSSQTGSSSAPASSTGASSSTAKASPQSDPAREKLIKQIYQEFHAGPPQKKFIYPVDTDWTSTVTNYDYNTPEQAHLSWKISWILEGMYYAYQATGDGMFLDESARMYHALLNRRDDAEQRPAFDGTTYPLWGSTSRYNGAFYTITDENGNALARLQFRSEHNDQTYVSVEPNNAADTFTLRIRHKGKVYSLSGLTMGNLKKRVESEIGWTFYGSPRADKRVVEVNWLTDDTGAMPAPQDYTLVDNTNVPTPVHTALILEPMVQTYLEMKRTGHPDTGYFRAELLQMFDALLENNWDDRGFFREMENAPTFYNGGGIIPWNQQLPLVAAMALFANAENDAELKQVVRKACDYFSTKLTVSDGAYLWRYWEDPSKTVTYWETTNYGAIDLNSIRLIHSTGLGFSDTDMARFTKTIGRILKKPATPATRIDGSSPSANNLALLQKYLPFLSEMPQLGELVAKQTLPWDVTAKLVYFQDQASRNAAKD